MARVERPHERPLVLGMYGRGRLYRMEGQTNGRIWEVPLICNVHTEVFKLMCKELRENAPAARGRQEAGFTQFLTHKYTLLSRHDSKEVVLPMS